MHDPNMLVEVLHDFEGAALPDQFTGTTTQTDGTPTVSVNAAAGVPGEVTLDLDNAGEAQSARLDFNDKLSLPITLLDSIEFRAKVDGSLAVAGSDAVSIAIGIATAHNATISSISQFALFRKKAGANNTLLCESDDNGSYDLDDKDSGFTINYGNWQRFKIDLSNLSDVKFYAEVNGVFRRLCANVTFNLSAVTGAVQPYCRIDKTVATDENTLRIDYVHYRYRRA